MRNVGLVSVVLALAFLFACSSPRGSPGRGGGFYVFCNPVDLAPVNDYVAGYGFPSFGDTVILLGGGGSGGRGRVEWGGFGGGSIRRVFSGTDEAELRVGFGGIRLGYCVEETDRLDVLVSGGLGGLGANLLLTGTDSAEFSLSSVLMCAGAAIRYHVTRSVCFEAGADYNHVAHSCWRREAGILPEPEPTDLSGISLRVGLRFELMRWSR
jgi:hypothetical protein